MFALKAARDAVNTRPQTPGHLLIVGTGSHKSRVTDMATRRSQPFSGAVSAPYEPLGRDFVQWKRQQLQALPGVKLPCEQAMWEGFLAMGQRPEELQNALVQVQSRAEPPDLAFPIICSTLASAAADVEIAAVEELGTLAATIFNRIAQGGEAGASGLFAAEAMAGYAASIGSAVDTPQVQNMVDRMMAANLIMRKSHGVYAVADPFVRQVWLQRAALEAVWQTPAPPAPGG